MCSHHQPEKQREAYAILLGTLLSLFCFLLIQFLLQYQEKLLSTVALPATLTEQVLHLAEQRPSLSAKLENQNNHSESSFRDAASILTLPNVLLIGAGKAGTTAMAAWMYKDLGMCRPKRFHGEPRFFGKEVHFFNKDHRYKKGTQFYAKRFQHCNLTDPHATQLAGTVRTQYAMDASPSTFLFPDRVRKTYELAGEYQLNSLKIIFIVREPAARLLSWYNHQAHFCRRHKDKSTLNTTFYGNIYVNESVLTFSEYAERIVQSNDTRGFYGERIEEWFQSFDRPNQFLTLSYDEFKSNPEMTQWRVQQFLGIENPTFSKIGTKNANNDKHKISEIDCPSQTKLLEFYQQSNERFYELLNTYPGPSMEARPFPKFIVGNCSNQQ